MKKWGIRALALCFALMLVAGNPGLRLTSLAEAGKIYIPSLFDGSGLDFSPYQGKAVILCYFVENDPTCIQQLIDLKRLQDEYDPEQLQILLIHVWDGKKENAKSIQRVAKSYMLEDMRFVEDKKKKLAKVMGVPAYPTTVFIGKEGDLHDAFARPLGYDQLAELVDAIGVGKLGDPEDPPSTQEPEATPPVPQGIQILPPAVPVLPSPTATNTPGSHGVVEVP